MAKVGRPIKFGIRLTPEERTRLEGMIHCGKGAINSALKARILLKADVSENGPGWSDERIAEALETSLSTVFRTRRQFVKEGLDAALSRKKSSWSPPRIFDGEAEARLIALACSKPPQGYTRWTMQMLEKRVVELGIVEKDSDTTIFRVLKKNGNYMRKCATNMFGPGFPMIIYKCTLVVKNSVSVLPTNPHISTPRSAFAKLCPPLAHFRM